MEFRRSWSPGKPVSLVQRDGRLHAIRLVSATGERRATHLRPFTLADSFPPPLFARRPQSR